jgi:hypothetical protein
MQYQYADDQNRHQSDKKGGAIRKNWERLGEISAGDWFVAYLKPETVYAIGRVITPRRAKTSHDSTDTINNYLKHQHNHQSGYVYYTAVFYEDFADEWRHPNNIRYPQRIDVDEWRHFVPGGVAVKGLGTIPPYELQKAAFKIEKDYFEAIATRLASFDDSSHDGTTSGDLEEGLDVPVIPEEVLTPERYKEGASRTIAVNAYERNSAARQACIDHYGYKCAACQKSMAELYGDVAQRIVHVHHLTELARI